MINFDVFVWLFFISNRRLSPHPQENSSSLIFPEPFAFFHQVPKNGMCISIDLRKYGNEARFVRRSCKPNAEIRHIVGKGTLHAYIVSLKHIELDEEITVSHEFQSIAKGPNYDYTVAPFPLPCACVDMTTCTARISETPRLIGISEGKKNGSVLGNLPLSPPGSE